MFNSCDTPRSEALLVNACYEFFVMTLFPVQFGRCSQWRIQTDGGGGGGGRPQYWPEQFYQKPVFHISYRLVYTIAVSMHDTRHSVGHRADDSINIAQDLYQHARIAGVSCSPQAMMSTPAKPSTNAPPTRKKQGQTIDEPAR